MLLASISLPRRKKRQLMYYKYIKTISPIEAELLIHLTNIPKCNF
jgi:hypothetical protein